MTKNSVLIVEDDPQTLDVLVQALQDDYLTIAAMSAEEAVNRAREQVPDLVILDLNLPDRDGLWVCSELRRHMRTKHIPVFILSSRRELHEKLEAYSVGADDFLEKPFTMPEFRAKVGAKMRRLDEKRPRFLEFGNLVLKVDSLELCCQDQCEKLSALETRLMTYFMENPGVALPRQQILERVWEDVNVSGRTVDTHVVSLRRKSQNSNVEIVTIYGAGYMLKIKSPEA